MNKVLNLFFVFVFTFCIQSQSQQSTKPKCPSGVDPESIQINTSPEPKLKQTGMLDLFNGKDLTGWTVKGGNMPFTVKNGELIGTCDPNVRLNSFLVTNDSFSDFIFTAEYKWDELSNSGVMFRAGVRPLQDGERMMVEDRSLLQVFGYQCEIETSERRWTGGIYGEAMGGWKNPLSKEKEQAAARAAVKQHKEWNRVTIYAKADHIMTWINGVPCANLIDKDQTSGFIGLQVHQGKKGQIRWRNLKIKDLSS